jgi:hypothetical protein
MTTGRDTALRWLVVVFSGALGMYFLYDSFVFRYLVNADSFTHVFWMEQFRDSALFRGDVLAEGPKYFAPQGYVLLYKAASVICAPLTLSKVLPVILFSLSALYLFNLLKQIANNGYSVCLGVFIFMLTPCFLERMSGGHARAFGFLLVFMFLYHWIRREFAAVSFVLIAQALFYPMMFLPSATAYALGFAGMKNGKISLDLARRKTIPFIAAVLVCGLLVSWQYSVVHNSALGRTISRQDMLGNPAFYKFGRQEYLPLPSVGKAVTDNLRASVLLNGKVRVRISERVAYVPGVRPRLEEKAISRFLAACASGLEKLRVDFLSWRMRTAATKVYYTGFLDLSGVFFVVFYAGMVFFILGLIQKRIPVPGELFIMFAASIALYVIASRVMPLFSLPTRYLEYSVKVIGLLCFCLGIADGIFRVQNRFLRRGAQIAVLALFALFFNFNKNNFLEDFSRYEGLYRYAETLPKDALIAGHPKLIDGIPLFSRRMAFVNYHVSLPYLTEHWKTVTRRTDDFFRAYYSDDLRDMAALCAKQGISCLVVDEANFSRDYLTRGLIYIEPFNSRILVYAYPGKDFALLHIPRAYRQYVAEGVFAVNAEDLKRYAAHPA